MCNRPVREEDDRHEYQVHRNRLKVEIELTLLLVFFVRRCVRSLASDSRRALRLRFDNRFASSARDRAAKAALEASPNGLSRRPLPSPRTHHKMPRRSRPPLDAEQKSAPAFWQ